MARMANAASQQGLEVGKERLRSFLENSDAGRQAMAMSGQMNEIGRDGIRMNRLNGDGKKSSRDIDEDMEDI